MGTKAAETDELFGVTVDRCPLAILRDMPQSSVIECDQIIRMAVAKMNGSLSPFPGTYSARALALMDRAESEIMAMRAQRQKEEAAKYETKREINRG